MAITRILSRWRADATIGDNISAWESIPAQQAQFVPFAEDIHPQLTAALRASGIAALYTHQAQAWEQAQAGHHLAITTGTASGKTLCYLLPVLDRLLKNPAGRALLIFPTKALAQDQLQKIKDVLAAGSFAPTIAPATYDGDTPTSARSKIREDAQLVITNPDMLHTGILPQHTRWAAFLRGLEFVVVDEMHSYRGVFGSHVANVLRRLKRLAVFYKAAPQFVLTSATIGNPQALAEHLIEAPVNLIDRDGSRRGKKYFLIYNPPIVNAELGIRAGLMQEVTRLAQELLAAQIQTIVFGRTRRTVELMLRNLQLNAEMTPEAVRAYRSGYLPKKRREIEAGLRSGAINIVFATTALELGIDIGGMGAAVLAGYPGSIAASLQQTGRAGRSDEDSLAILVASANPLDQFLARYPDYFFRSPVEKALINPNNLLILLSHLQCAAFELPFREGERFGDANGEQVAQILAHLQETGILHKSAQKYFWVAEDYPAAAISLRSASPNRIALQDTSKIDPQVIGEMDMESAPWMVHPEAIYLHAGDTYLVDALDLEGKIAALRPVEVDFFTRPQRNTEIRLIELRAQASIPGGGKAYGDLSVITQVVGYQRVRWGTNENLGFGEVDLPPTELLTMGFWLSLAEPTVAQLRAEGLWNSDPNRYGANWNKQRNLARLRDGYCCQACGLPEGAEAHHVHHKQPFRTFEIAEEANRLDNLITLCPSCHRRAESALRIRSGLAGLGYVLGNLAPLFLLCDPGDLQVHTDPQSPLVDGQPAVIIYEDIPAGIGFSESLFDSCPTLMAHALDLVQHCPCSDGCPACVGPGGEAGTGGKQETLAVLNALNGY